MSKFREICEELRIKKKWNFKNDDGYTIEINDTDSHPIIDRIINRTDVKLNDMNNKLQKGINLLLVKLKKGFFKKDINFIELTYKKSKFKVIFMVKPKAKYIRISSIFQLDFKTDNALIWDINEFKKLIPEIPINDSTYEFYTIDNEENDRFFSAEINESTKSFDVYISDMNDVINLEVDL